MEPYSFSECFLYALLERGDRWKRKDILLTEPESKYPFIDLGKPVRGNRKQRKTLLEADDP